MVILLVEFEADFQRWACRIPNVYLTTHRSTEKWLRKTEQLKKWKFWV